jgi:hypothetical protein
MKRYRCFTILAGSYVLVLLALIASRGCHAYAQQGRMNVHSSQPPLPPAQAAAVLANGPGTANRTGAAGPWAAGPWVASTGAQGAALGPWAWPAPTEPRRLDGTLLSQPAQVYGDPYAGLGVPHVYPWRGGVLRVYGLHLSTDGHPNENRPISGSRSETPIPTGGHIRGRQ